jgi:MFS family permease
MSSARQAQPPSTPARFEHSFVANVALVVLTLFPGLINTSAINFAAGPVAHDLGVSPNAVSVLVLLNDSALAFGCLLAAELTRRLPNRSLYLVMLLASIAASALSCGAPNIAVLGVAHVVHGLVGGMLFVIALPPLFINFAAKNIRALVIVLVPSLFGAVTLGPIVAAGLQRSNEWRLLFAIEIVFAIVALLLARVTVTRKPPAATTDSVDWVALALAATGSVAIGIGAGDLARHGWLAPSALAPAILGVGAFVAMFVWEALQPRPLVPVRHLLGSIAIVGSLSTIAGSAVYSATQTTMTLELERLHGLSISQAGLSYAPAALAALLAGWLYSRFVTTRWVTLVGAAGLAISLAAVCVGFFARTLTYVEIEATLFVAAIGAGLSITPGIFMVALAFERTLVTRAIALLNMLRLTGGFISVPGVEHSIGSRAADHLREALPTLSQTASDRAARAFLLRGEGTPGISHALLEDAVRAGVGYGLTLAALIGVVALAVIGVFFASRRIRLKAPDVALLAEGRPALSAT